jgi:hypothetical protein
MKYFLDADFIAEVGKLPLSHFDSKTYEISPDGKSIKCLRCWRTSFHPEDVRNKFCGYCHRFHEDP